MALTGPISLAKGYLRDSIADSATFRTWIGATGNEANQNAQGLARVHFESLPPKRNRRAYTLNEIKKLRPFAIVSNMSLSMRHEGTGSTYNFIRAGKLTVSLENDIRAAIKDDPAKIAEEFENTIGGIIADLEAKSGLAGYLAIETIEMEGVTRTHPDYVETEGDTMATELTIEWEGV